MLFSVALILDPEVPLAALIWGDGTEPKLGLKPETEGAELRLVSWFVTEIFY